MSDTKKFLFLDTADAVPCAPAEPCTAEHEDEPCPCCEASLSQLIAIIRDCGQDPVIQLSGYLITEDPTYLPDGTNADGMTARGLARRVGRDKLLTTLIELYIRYCPDAAPSSAL